MNIRRDDFISFKNRKMASCLGLALLVSTGVSYVGMHNHITDLESELVASGEINDSLTYTIVSLEDSIVELEDVVGDLTNEKRDLLAEKEDLVMESSKLAEEIIVLEKDNENLKSKLSHSEKELDKVKSTQADKTTKSKQSVDSTKASTSKNDNTETSSSKSEWTSMTVNASAYTLVEHGDKLGGTGLTSTGKVPTANRTIAVDPRVIPYGSLVQYNGVTYVAEDTGGMIKGNKVDIYMDTLDQAVTFGRKDINILVKTPK